MALHGGIDQYDRDSTILDFKSGNIRLLVSVEYELHSPVEDLVDLIICDQDNFCYIV